MLVNNPESPLLRGLYEDSPYYRSYLDLPAAAGGAPPARPSSATCARALPAEDFNDWHHVTYIGADQARAGVSPSCCARWWPTRRTARDAEPCCSTRSPSSVFLPIVLLGVHLLPQRWRNPFLLAASYVFYGAWDWRFLLLLFGTTCVDFVAGAADRARADPARRRRAFLLLSLGTNLTVLGFFKYYNFFVGSAVAAADRRSGCTPRRGRCR